MPNLSALRDRLNARFHTDVDGRKAPPSIAIDVWIRDDTPLRLTIQTEEDGSYRTSVLRIGYLPGGVDIFANRTDLVRLLTAIATHLDAIDVAEQGGPGDVAALFAESMRREMERSEEAYPPDTEGPAPGSLAARLRAEGTT